MSWHEDIATRGRAKTDTMEWLWSPIRRAVNASNCWLTVLWIATEHNIPSDTVLQTRHASMTRPPLRLRTC